MPETPSTGFWHQPFLWRCAAADMLVRCTCRYCRRTVHYYAKDLLEVFHRNAVVGEIWGACPRCGKNSGWREQERYASSDDVGHTIIRRPNGYRKTLLWRNEYYGPQTGAGVESEIT